MKNQDKNQKRWVVDILLVVSIIAMGVYIYYRLMQMDPNRDENGDLSAAPTNTAIIEPTKNLDQDQTLKSTSDSEESEIGMQSALDFRLESLNDGIVSLSDFIGTPVMVNFWATWCPPCRAEMPLIQELAAENQDDFIVLAINVGEDRPTIESFVNSNHFYDLIFLLDPENTIASLYRVPGFPTSLFIDSEGFLRSAHIGELDRDLLNGYLAEIGVKE